VKRSCDVLYREHVSRRALAVALVQRLPLPPGYARWIVARSGTGLGFGLDFPGRFYNMVVMNESGYGRSESNRLDRTFAALANPTRRALLARLASGKLAVSELAEPFSLSQPAVSRHLKVLERAGLISSGSDARPLAEATEWLETYREYWEASFARLDGLLSELKTTKTKRKRVAPKKR
jgi:DNA-binding transcriptional ArsR family regulator